MTPPGVHSGKKLGPELALEKVQMTDKNEKILNLFNNEEKLN